MKELKVDAERVRAAAAKCSTANATLRELFPEAFEDEYVKFKEGQQLYGLSDLAPFIGYARARTGG